MTASKLNESALSQLHLKELLHYCPDSGIFKNTKSRKRVISGSISGTISWNGYVVITIKGKPYRAHRLAWLYMTGEWPSHDIDHINGIRHENKWVNLREATRSQNLCNTSIRSDNTSGYKGVSFYKSRNKFESYININGKRKKLGYYLTALDAYAAHCKEAASLHGAFSSVTK